MIEEAREQLVFKDKILQMATNIIQLMAATTEKKVVVVGVHVRRGDKLRVWRQSKFIQDILGRYEGKYFRYSMNLMRQRYNSDRRKVVFIVTSDNVSWTKTQLGNHSDTFFSADYTRAPPTGPTAMGRVGKRIFENGKVDD